MPSIGTRAGRRLFANTARASLLPMLPTIGLLVGIISAPVSAAMCSPEDAAQIAVSRYGGQALSITADGDHFIVRLRLPDGQVLDVAIERDSC